MRPTERNYGLHWETRFVYLYSLDGVKEVLGGL